jgi:hypothetical protein
MEDRLEIFHNNQVEHIFLYKKFEELCPFYMSIGMSYKEFWEGDVTLTKVYLASYKIKEKREYGTMKWQNWEQGLYIYEALCDVSPILRAFSKSKKPLPYPERPYGMEGDEKKKKEEKSKKKQEKQKELELYRAQIFFKNWAKNTSNHFKQQEGGKE